MLRTFLEIFSGVDREYDSDEANGYFSEHECFYHHGEQPLNDEPKATPPDLTPTWHAVYLPKKAEHLKERQANLEAECIQLELRKEEMEHRQASSARTHACAIQRKIGDNADTPCVERCHMIFGGT